MLKNLKSSKNLMKLLHKFNRYNKREKIFVVYLFVLLFFLLFFPIVTISSLRVTGATSVWLLNTEFFKTAVVVLVSMVLLIGWNVSFKFKNMLTSYFGSRENDSVINFLFLFIITTSFFAITDTIGVVSEWLTTTVSVSAWWQFIQIWLLLWVVMTMISVVKSAQETGKKTKIINMVDEEHNKEETIKSEIKKWLFDK